MARDNEKSGSSVGRSDRDAPEETSTLKTLVGGAVNGANGIIDTARQHWDDPAAPLSYAESLIPAPILAVTRLNTDSIIEGGATLAFNTAGQVWDKAVEFVSRHGKKDPDAAVADADPAMGGNVNLPGRPAGKDKPART